MNRRYRTKFNLPIPLRLPGDRIGTLAFAAAVAGPLLLYVVTLPRTVVLEDDGLFLMAGASLGVAHPPGYPLYTLICHLFMQLPGSPAFLGHLSSAVLGAFACGALYVCARLLGTSAVPSLAAAWLFGASEHFWAQAIITEVYTLNALLFFALLALLLHGVRHPDRHGTWLAAAMVYGLSLANHWPLMVLATPGLAVTAWPAWRTILRRWRGLLADFLPSVALPYAWMVWRSHQNPFLNFYGPIDSLQALWFYISRSGYAHVDTSPSAGWSDRLQFLQWLGHEVVWQLTLPGFVLAVVGLWILLHRREWVMAGSGLLVFLGNSAALVVLLGFDFDYFRVAIFRPYTLLCYGIVALWLAVGLQYFCAQLARLPFVFAQRRWAGTGVALFVGVLLVAFSIQASWRLNDRSRSDFNDRYAQMIFGQLPKDAIMFTFVDAEAGPLGYYQYVEKHRPDVTVLNAWGLVFGTRLYDHRLPRESKRKALTQFVESTDRPVFFPTTSDLFPDLQGRMYGFLTQALLEGQPGTIDFKRQPIGEQYFKHLISRRAVDSWERHRRDDLLFRYGQYLGVLSLFADSDVLDPMHDLYRLAQTNHGSLFGLSDTLLENGNGSHWNQVAAWLEKVEVLVENETLTKRDRAQLYYLKGRLFERTQQMQMAIGFFRKSWDIFPHPERNKALDALNRLK